MNTTLTHTLFVLAGIALALFAVVMFVKHESNQPMKTVIYTVTHCDHKVIGHACHNKVAGQP